MSRYTVGSARRVGVALLLMLALGAGALVAPGGTEVVDAQATQAIAIVDFAFNPASATVPMGARVTWTNNGQVAHTTTSQTGGWDSGPLNPGQSFTLTASRAGSFDYICTIHPNMRATLVVQAAAAPAPAPAPAPGAAPPAAPAQQAPVAAPRTGTGGGINADNEGLLPALAVAAVLLLGVTGLAYARRRE